MGITIERIIELLNAFIEKVDYWKICQPHKIPKGFEEKLKELINLLNDPDANDFSEDIKSLLKNESGEELFPVFQSYCEGENLTVNSILSVNDLIKILPIVGDGLLDLTTENPVSIRLLTKEENLEAEYNGNIYGNGVSCKIAFLEANGFIVPKEMWEEEESLDSEEHLSYAEAKSKYSHILEQSAR